MLKSCAAVAESVEFFIVVLGARQGGKVVRSMNGYGFYPGKTVYDNIVQSGDVSHVRGELRDELQVIKLPW
jgi:hypothetical protein